jgi:hypothetical protein
MKRVCLCLTTAVLVLDLEVPFAVLMTKTQWNGVNNYSESGLFLMYMKDSSETLPLLNLLFGIEVVLGLSFFLLINAANCFYWLS